MKFNTLAEAHWTGSKYAENFCKFCKFSLSQKTWPWTWRIHCHPNWFKSAYHHTKFKSIGSKSSNQANITIHLTKSSMYGSVYINWTRLNDNWLCHITKSHDILHFIKINWENCKITDKKLFVFLHPCSLIWQSSVNGDYQYHHATFKRNWFINIWMHANDKVLRCNQWSCSYFLWPENLTLNTDQDCLVWMASTPYHISSWSVQKSEK